VTTNSKSISHLHSWVGDPDPDFDQEFASGIIGKYLLVGITHTTHGGEMLSQEQLHGVIVSASPEGMDIELHGVNEGKTWRMPPFLDKLSPAKPGIYKLRSTGEAIENPDFTFALSIRKARMQ
jgi:hypothetical protein